MTNARIIDGKAFAAKLRETVGQNVADLQAKHQITPGLAVILVGEDPASEVYVRNKSRFTKEAGMNSFEYKLSATTTEAELIAKIELLNKDDSVHGILVQLPLPKHINENAVIETISPDKDVDGFHVINTGRMATGQEGLIPCTPLGCLMLLQDTLGDLTGLHAVVIGRSNIVGKPMSALLLNANCTVTTAHRHSKNVPELCKKADIVVVAVGRPEMVKSDWIKPGATVIDVGINRISTTESGKAKLVGDVDFADVSTVAGAITPVPGGVGPMTIACLLANTVKAACLQHKVAVPNSNNKQAA